MTATPAKPLEVFYSYAHTDERLRRKLETHLSNLKRQGFISEWHDRNISAGSEWEREISGHLNTAHIILLLVSPDFMASDYCYSKEMMQAMERHEAGEARVIPILLRPVDWKGAPFEKLQALPTNAKPVTKWQNSDDAFFAIVKGIRNAIEELNTLLSDISLSSENIHVDAKNESLSLRLWNIPLPRNPFFTDREDLLSQLSAALRTGSATALTQPQAISGLGGIGKTQAALEYAFRYQINYHVVLWARADTRENLISDFVSIAARAALPEKDAQEQHIVITAVKEWLRKQTQWLLILDNVDDLKLVQEFLPSTYRGHVLLTTRAQAMGMIAQRMEVEKMEPEVGALFILRRANIIAPDAPLDYASEADRAKAREITEAMGGLPLALDQAGAYIEETACSLSDYLDLYQTRRAELLKVRGGVVPDHPEPVATTWSLAFEKIALSNPAAVELLRLCAFLHPDAIPEEVITKGAPDLGPILQPVATNPLKLNASIGELLKYSLVRRTSNLKILSIHRLVQAVLKEEMDEDLQRLWAERTVRAVNRTFPDVKFATWPRCQRCLPHAQVCATLIDQWDMKFKEAIRLLYVAGCYLQERAQYAESESLCVRALTISEQIHGPEHLEVATILNSLAWLYYSQGKYTQAESLYQRALSIREKTLGLQHPDVATSLSNLTKLYNTQGKYNQAESLGQQAVAILEKTLGPDHPDVATSLNNLAWTYYAQGKYPQAETLFQKALDIRRSVLEPEHPSVSISLNNLARLYHTQGKYAQAEPLFLQALNIRERVLGPEHPEVARYLNNLAMIYRDRGKYDQAEPLCIRAVATFKKTLGLEHPDVAPSLNNLALLYYLQGKYTQAEPLFRQVLAIREKTLDFEHPDVAATLNDLALLYYAQGNYIEAEPLFQQALTIREKALGFEHPDTAQSLNNLAQLYYAQGKYTQAEPLFTRAVTISERSLGPYHPNVATYLENYATLLRKINRQDEATELEVRAHSILTKHIEEDPNN